jgi:DNA-binding transcriptional MerR regulator
MNTQGFVAGPLSVLCIVALVMGTASAAVITATGSTSDKGAIPAHLHPSPGSIISHLQQQGVDVTEVKTALQNGDTEAVNAWLEAHRPERPDGTGRSSPDLTDPTKQQEIITRLEEEGVDVTELKTALQNGDSAAVQAWLRTHFHDHRPAHKAPGLGDPTREQKIIDRLEKQGVDVTEVKADLQSGDTTAVQTWLETYLHSHEGEMGCRHLPAQTPTMTPTGTSGPDMG